MSNIYTLRPDNLSQDTVKCLAQLHTQAKRGLVVGFAFVAYVDGYGFIANAAGQALKDPNNTRGMIKALDDKLAPYVTGHTL
jgi:hypothetical protein